MVALVLAVLYFVLAVLVFFEPEPYMEPGRILSTADALTACGVGLVSLLVYAWVFWKKATARNIVRLLVCVFLVYPVLWGVMIVDAMTMTALDSAPGWLALAVVTLMVTSFAVAVVDGVGEAVTYQIRHNPE